MRDTSLRVPPGVEGTVIDAKIFARKGTERDSRSQYIEEEAIALLNKDRDDEIRIITKGVRAQIAGMLIGKVSAGKISDPKKKRILLKKGDVITEEVLERTPFELWREISLERRGRRRRPGSGSCTKISPGKRSSSRPISRKRSKNSRPAMNCRPG